MEFLTTDPIRKSRVNRAAELAFLQQYGHFSNLIHRTAREAHRDHWTLTAELWLFVRRYDDDLFTFWTTILAPCDHHQDESSRSGWAWGWELKDLDARDLLIQDVDSKHLPEALLPHVTPPPIRTKHRTALVVYAPKAG